LNRIETASIAVEGIRRANQTLCVAAWRHWLIGSIVYAVGRCLSYAVRFGKRAATSECLGSKPIYIQFGPTCASALEDLRSQAPGDIVGFVGNSHANLPIYHLVANAIALIISPAFVRWVWNCDHTWRPWVADVAIYIEVRRWANDTFSKIEPTLLISSHDHCAFDRALIDAGHDFGHKSIYAQHAAVTQHFPPLATNFSLLDGKSSADIYSRMAESSGVAVVCGRQYGLANLRFSPRSSNRALICTNALNDLSIWNAVIEAFKAQDFAVSIRTHPSDRRAALWRKFCARHGVTWLDPKRSSLRASLSDVSHVIAGQSSVILEARIAGTTPIIIQFPEDTKAGLYDYYGFARSGLSLLSDPLNIANDLAFWLKDPPSLKSEPATWFDLACSADRNFRRLAFDSIVRSFPNNPDFSAIGFSIDRSGVLNSEALDVFFPDSQPSRCGTSAEIGEASLDRRQSERYL